MIACVLIACKAQHSGNWEPLKKSIHFTHDCIIVLSAQLIQTGSVLVLLPFSTVLGFTLYENTGNGRAATHQLYSSAIEIWYALIALILASKLSIQVDYVCLWF